VGSLVGPGTITIQGITHLNEHGRQTLVPRGGNRGVISGYRPERTFLSMRESAWEAAQQGQPGGGVGTMTTLQLPQLLHVVRSQLF
jgi:hypothetical protein